MEEREGGRQLESVLSSAGDNDNCISPGVGLGLTRFPLPSLGRPP